MKRILALVLLVVGQAMAATTAPTTQTSTGTTGTGTDTSVACRDDQITDARVNSIKIGMSVADVTAILVCEGKQGTAYVDGIGNSLTPWTWLSPNKSLLGKFKDGKLYSLLRGGLSDAEVPSGPASYDDKAYTLTVPALWAGGMTFTDVVLAVPPGGKWAVLSLKDAKGVVVAPPVTQTTVVLTGTISDYAGIGEGTIFTIGAEVWRGKAGCSFGATEGVTSASATIYSIGPDLILTIKGDPATCKVERLI